MRMRKGIAIVITFMVAFTFNIVIYNNAAIADDSGYPVANFTWQPHFPKPNQNITFNANSSYDSDGYIVNYTWQFGDGDAGYGKIVIHNYSKEGVYRVCLKVKDNESKNSTICKNITVDGTPPATSYELIPSSPNGKNGWYISKVEIRLNATDNLSGVNETKYKIDNSAWKKYSNPIQLNLEGYHIIRFYSIDNSGNEEEEKNISLRIDLSPPSTDCIIDKNATNGWYTESVNVTLVARDSISGINKTYYVLDDVIHEYNGTITIGEGNHSFVSYSVDNAGNIETPHNMRIRVDKHAPDINIIAPSKGIYLFGRKMFSTSFTLVIGNITIKAAAIDNLSGVAHVDFYIDGVFKYNDSTPPYSWNWNERAFGKKEVKLVAYDVAGNHAYAKEDVLIFHI